MCRNYIYIYKKVYFEILTLERSDLLLMSYSSFPISFFSRDLAHVFFLVVFFVSVLSFSEVISNLSPFCLISSIVIFFL